MMKTKALMYEDLSETAKRHAEKVVVEGFGIWIDGLKHGHRTRKEMDEMMDLRNHPQKALPYIRFSEDRDPIDLLWITHVRDYLRTPRH
jgi:hypothetical protein